jgi:hypothetical protein
MPSQVDRNAETILGLLAMAEKNWSLDGDDLATASELSPDSINDAVALLVDDGLAEVWGTEAGPYDFAAVNITPKGGQDLSRRLTVVFPVPHGAGMATGAGPNTTLQLFISHAEEDAALAARVITLMEKALRLPASAIRCTSVDGYRLPGGANTIERLRQEVHDAAFSSASFRLRACPPRGCYSSLARGGAQAGR